MVLLGITNGYVHRKYDQCPQIIAYFDRQGGPKK